MELQKANTESPFIDNSEENVPNSSDTISKNSESMSCTSSTLDLFTNYEHLIGYKDQSIFRRNQKMVNSFSDENNWQRIEVPEVLVKPPVKVVDIKKSPKFISAKIANNSKSRIKDSKSYDSFKFLSDALEKNNNKIDTERDFSLKSVKVQIARFI